MNTHGFILGKFAPLHLGHEFLIRQALNECDALTVLVHSSPLDAIPGWLRYHALKNTFPELDVRHLTSLENLSAMLEQFRDTQPIIFESGETQLSLVEKFNLKHTAIDMERKNFPVTTKEIRENPQHHWELISRQMRPHYIQRVALVGPESCGKSYLAEKLAAHFNTVFVEEYGRTYCEKFGMDSTELDFAHVAGGQLYREDEMALEANRILFCDTELIVTQVWSEVYFKGKCQPWIYWADHARRYDLFLLCAPDIPWVNDGLREFEKQRTWMFERLRQELESRSLRYEIIQGGFEERTKAAISAVEKIAHDLRP